MSHPHTHLSELLNMLPLGHICTMIGGMVSSWIVHSTPEQSVRVQVLGMDIVLYFWVRHSPHPCIQVGTSEFDAGGNPTMGSRNIPNPFMLRKLEISADLMSHLARV